MKALYSVSSVLVITLSNTFILFVRQPLTYIKSIPLQAIGDFGHYVDSSKGIGGIVLHMRQFKRDRSYKLTILHGYLLSLIILFYNTLAFYFFPSDLLIEQPSSVYT